ncbi:MAG: PAS domain S-box protein [Thiobacillus sp.]|nr:PAS domain S-box protein [Thiobacillus sp.]
MDSGFVKVKFPLRLFLILFALVSVLIVGGAWYIGNERISAEMDITRTKEIGNVIMGVRRLDDELAMPLRHLRALADTVAVRNALEGGGAGAVLAMEDEFKTLLAYSGLYDKVRWIDAGGVERARINSVGGRPVPVPADRLQQVTDSYYFKKTMDLQPGQFFISPLDLNVENGEVEVPYKPVLRLATPLRDANRRPQGILVLNIDARRLLTAFTESVMDARDHAMLLNSQGYWLVSPRPEEAWGFMFKRNDTLGARNPKAWQAISGIPSGQVEAEGGLWTWSTAYPLKDTDSSVVADVPHWLVVSHLPANQLALLRQEAWRTVGLGALTMLLLFGALTAWLSRALVGRTVAKVAAAKAQAEARIANRLAEAQKRFRLVVEANANGLLVVDDKGAIQMANPALERMFGYEPGELIGKPMEILVPESERAGHEQKRSGYMRAPEARPMGAGRDLVGQRKDGSRVPIEISLSSFMEDGRRYVDAVVADISARKEIEERLQHREAHLRMLLDTNPNGLLVVDERGNIQMVNTTLEAMFGYEPDELLGKPIEILVPEAATGHQAAFSGDMPRHPVVTMLGRQHFLQGHRKDESTFPIEMNLSGFNEDGKLHIQATVMDRRERIAA